jgi:hypothetical protein
MYARVCLPLLGGLLALLLCSTLSSCGGFTVGMGYGDGYGYDGYRYGSYPPRSYMYGLPYGYRPYNGDWYDDYCHNDGLWYYRGINTPYDWCWPDYAY